MPSGVPHGQPDAADAGEDLRSAGDRIEALLASAAADGAAAAGRAEDLLACVSGLYGAGLARVLDILDGAGALSEDLLAALAGDDLVASLLLVHGLHPYDVETRVRRALDTVRPYLGSHDGDVELLGVTEEGVVRLRLLGSCDGCPSSSVTLQLAVEGAVEAAAPEMTRIEVEIGRGAEGGASVIPVDALFTRIKPPATAEPAGGGTWVAVPELDSLGSGELAGFDVAGLTVCACRIGQEVFCFQDRCAHCGESLAGGVVERRLGAAAGTGVLRCGHCRSHYDIKRAGAGLDDPAEHLRPLPVLLREGSTSIAVPAAVAS